MLDSVRFIGSMGTTQVTDKSKRHGEASDMDQTAGIVVTPNEKGPQEIEP